MTTFRILHCADLHLDSPLRGLEADPDAPAEKIRGATRAALSNLVELALAEQVAVVLIAGDLYDGDWQDWRTGQVLVRELARLTRAGIHVVAISGNHDADSIITKKLRWPEGARLLRTDRPETIRFDDLGLAVHGQGFSQRDVTRNLAVEYPAPVAGLLNIGLLHTAAGGRPGHDNYAPCTLDQLIAKGYDYWALGHVHTREILCRDPWVMFPGNVQGRHIGEPGAKGALLIEVADGRIVGVPAFRALDVLRWHSVSVDLAGVADEDAAMAQIRHALLMALEAAEDRLLAVRLHLTGATPVHDLLVRSAEDTRGKIQAEILAAGGGGLLWLERVVCATTPVAAPAPADPALAALLQYIEAPDAAALAASLQPYASALLDRAAGLRAGLGDAHPACHLADGALDAELLAEARALLLARLGA